jgi:photosystem II stability/assembly factor-like uncharacterized protein
MAFDPVDPNHLVVSATIGLLESHDLGKSFGWRCEPILGSPGNEDVLIAVTASGATVAATPTGILRTTDGCSFDRAPEVTGTIARDVSSSRSAPHSVFTVKLRSEDAGMFQSQLLRSDDDGASWSPVGGPLRSDLLPLTIDAAPSDAARVYLSARLGAANDFASVLLRSSDGGQTFDSADIPETSSSRHAFIAAVHPSDPDRVYIRVYDTAGTRIWATTDGGKTFSRLYAASDQLYGFAISPDGNQIAFGGPGDGIWVGAADGSGLARRSDVVPTCLGWSADGLYACADPKTVGFLVGRSRDTAASFETLVTFDSLCGHTGCAADTQSGKACPSDWERVAPVVGTTCGTDAGAEGVEAGELGDASVPSSPPNLSTLDPSGGGCRMASRPGGNAIWGSLLMLLLRLRRRRPGST